MEEKRFSPGSSIPGGYIRWLGHQIGRNPSGIVSASAIASSTTGMNAIIQSAPTAPAAPILALLTKKITPISQGFQYPYFVPYYEWQELIYNADNDTYAPNARYDPNDENKQNYTVTNNPKYDALGATFTRTSIDWADSSQKTITGNTDLDRPLDSRAGPSYALNEAAVLSPTVDGGSNGGAIDFSGLIVLLYPTGQASNLFPGLPTYNFCDDGALTKPITVIDSAIGSDLYWGSDLFNFDPNYPYYVILHSPQSIGILRSFPSDGQFLQPPNAPTGWGSDGNIAPVFLAGAPTNPLWQTPPDPQTQSGPNNEYNTVGLIPYIVGHDSLPVLRPLSVGVQNATGTITYRITPQDTGSADFNTFEIFYPAQIYSGIVTMNGIQFFVIGTATTVLSVQSWQDVTQPKSDFCWTNTVNSGTVEWPYGPASSTPPTNFYAVDYNHPVFQSDPNFLGQAIIGFTIGARILPNAWSFGIASWAFGNWTFQTDYQDA